MHWKDANVCKTCRKIRSIKIHFQSPKHRHCLDCHQYGRPFDGDKLRVLRWKMQGPTRVKGVGVMWKREINLKYMHAPE